MIKSLIFLLFVLICTISLSGQIQNDIKRKLDTRDFDAFKNYADSLSSIGINFLSDMGYFRDITNDFQEGVFYIETAVPSIDNPSISTHDIYKADLIVSNKIVTFYELSELKNKKIDDAWEQYYEIIDTFKDTIAFDSLKNSFKNIFYADLNEEDLFITEIVYSDDVCGSSGIPPVGRMQVDKWIAKKNKKELIKWLKSTNSEKQVYAVDGLVQIKAHGVKLTNEEMGIINYVCNKKGTINFCSGCSFSRENIVDVTRKFKL